MQGPSSPVVVGFPLRGEWVAVRTPAHKVPSHGTDMFGQRYAFDFVRPDHRAGLHLHPAGALRSFLLGGRTRDYYGWGQPVHAAFDGEVVEAVDGVPERARVHVVRELALALKTTVRFDPARRGLDPVAGNRVIVQGADAVALFVHLAPGTVSVTRGQEVRAGEVIGGLGTPATRQPPPALPAHGFDRPTAGQGHPLRLPGLPRAARQRVGAGRARHPWPTRTDPLRARRARLIGHKTRDEDRGSRSSAILPRPPGTGTHSRAGRRWIGHTHWVSFWWR